MKKKSFFIPFLVTFLLLLFVLVKERYPTRIYNRFFSDEQSKENENLYLLNHRYHEQTSFFNLYMKPKKIVMLGDSHTEWINWSELMQRDDIANRGISGDITSGFLHRLNDVYRLKPQLCVIEGGTNDILLEMEPNTIAENLLKITQNLRKKGIKTVICTVTYASALRDNAVEINQRMEKLNMEIVKLAQQTNSPVLDLNDLMCDGMLRRLEYALEDGLHFSAKAYAVWKEKLENVLKEQGV